MMSGGILDNKAFVTLNAFQDYRLLDGPLPNVSPVLVALRVFLLGVRRRPSRLPVVCELFEEGRF